MKKTILLVVMVLAGCAPSIHTSQSQNAYFSLADEACANKYHVPLDYKDDVPHPNEEKVTKCTKSTIKNYHENGKISEQSLVYFLSYLEQKDFLNNKRASGEIDRKMAQARMSEWHKQNTPTEFDFWDFVRRYNAYAKTPQGAYDSAIISGRNSEEAQSSYNRAAGIPQQRFHCSTMRIGEDMYSTDCN